jgi:tetratricopeptide (TPR) repeat protein
VLRRRGDPKAAAATLTKFVNDHPNAVVSRIALLSALRDSGDIDGAIKRARELLVRRSHDASALSELSLAHLERGEIDTAELLSQEALKADAKSAIAERTAGLIALKRGDDAIAFRHFARASELDPRDTTARSNIATVLLLAGVYDRAETEFRSVLENRPNDVPAMIGLAAALRGQGTRKNSAPYAEAEKLLRRALQLEPDNLSATLNLGLLYADFLQRPADSNPLFKRFLDQAPPNHPARALVEKKLSAQARPMTESGPAAN